MSIHETGPPGREERFARLFDHAYAPVLRFVERRVHPSHAEDIVADVFLVAWRRLDELPPDLDDARAWLFGVARRTLLAGLRGQQRQQALAVRIAENSFGDRTAELDVEFLARRMDVAQAWQRLSAVHQEALALAVWDGLDAPRAARVLGISPVAYRLRLSRARKALRAHTQSLPDRTPVRAAEAAAPRSTS
ncbi:sigma-70 family RNA polymerase sigma factor [Intrasporangium calvum]|uniref:Sigma-70 family RNA polymerase sigma factor n=1 Tax=Intrasporangium calvum TaxID=53358 RepID=A0ABT5GDV3_9MICO|nr:sigma-70 family RNA polymerase sigma factor [Intrasporangium calvum]MDC5696440.1 sigma-70 family RNA polymerase sigma factor [Intrasporangium calvum]